MNMHRHRDARVALGSLLAATLLAAPLARAQLLAGEEVREGEAAIEWGAKATCGTTEQGVTRYGMWEGRLYSRAPAERDRLIFAVIGINTRQCARVTDPQRGIGFRSVSREIMVYLRSRDRRDHRPVEESLDGRDGRCDPCRERPGQHARAIARPAGPMARRTAFRSGATTTRWWPSNEVPLFYENPLAGAYQDYVGGQYHAMEIFNTYYRAADFLDAKRKRIGESRISWQRDLGLAAVDENARPAGADGLQRHLASRPSTTGRSRPSCGRSSRRVTRPISRRRRSTTRGRTRRPGRSRKKAIDAKRSRDRR
jgi:hypothetical protein